MRVAPRAASVSASSEPLKTLSSALSPDFVARLLRSRPGAVGEHFAMHCKPLPAPRAGDARAGVLFLAIPKRQLARAVDRNLVRRVAREAWRASGFAALPAAVLVRLRRRPEWFDQAGVRRRRAGIRSELDALFADPALRRIALAPVRGDDRNL